MPDKEIFVLKIVWKKSIASLHRLTQAVQRANLRRTAGDPTWVKLSNNIIFIYGQRPKNQNAKSWGQTSLQKEKKCPLKSFVYFDT